MPINKLNNIAWAGINKVSDIASSSISTFGGQSAAEASSVEFFVDASDSSSYSGTGTTWSDIGPNGYDLTLTNGPTYNNGSIKHFNFDGANDYARNVGAGLQIFGATDAYTVEAWIRLTATSSIRTIIGKRSTSNSSNGWSISFRRGSPYNGLLWRNVSPNGFVDVVFNSNQSSVFLNTWRLLTCVKNSDGSVAVYINGSAASVSFAAHSNHPAGNLAFNMNTSAGNLAISMYGSSTSFEFIGGIGQAKIHSEALSSSEALASFNSDKTKYGY